MAESPDRPGGHAEPPRKPSPRPPSAPASSSPSASPILRADAALLVLVVALVLSIYKPRGLTGSGGPARWSPFPRDRRNAGSGGRP